MVLDGQQRLQSLFIGLRGSYLGRELYFDILSGVTAAPEDIRYRFAFRDKVAGTWPWVRFKDIIFQNSKLPGEIAEGLFKIGVDFSILCRIFQQECRVGACGAVQQVRV